MGFFSLVMLDIALNLAIEDPAYEDMASKFFEHFVMIVDAVNAIGGNTLFRKKMLICLYFVNFDVTLFFNFMLMLMLGKEMFPNKCDVSWLCIFCNNYS